MTADAHPARPPRAPSRRSLLQAGSLVLLLGTQQIARGASILAVRVWPAPEYSRVTIESDTKLVAKQFFVTTPPRLAVDIEGIDLSPELRELVAKVKPDDPNIAGIRVGQNAPGVVRLVVDLKQAAQPQVFTLPPIAAYQHRLVFDLYPAEPVDPLEALIAERLRDTTAPAAAATASAPPRPADKTAAPAKPNEPADPLGDLIAQHGRAEELRQPVFPPDDRMFEMDALRAPLAGRQLAHHGDDAGEREFRILPPWPDARIFDAIAVGRDVAVGFHVQERAGLQPALEQRQRAERRAHRAARPQQRLEQPQFGQPEPGAHLQPQIRFVILVGGMFDQRDIAMERCPLVRGRDLRQEEAMVAEQRFDPPVGSLQHVDQCRQEQKADGRLFRVALRHG